MTTIKLVIAPEAADDIQQAYSWYERQRTGLGEGFLTCVDACLATIRRSPELHAPVHENYRRALIRRFPYMIFYEYIEDVVTVFCVFHTSRDPHKWKARLR
jgi:toxin ParE1/3/4